MQRNFFLFEKQVRDLRSHLVGNRIERVFTYRKNELIITLSQPREFLHISVDVQFPYLLLGKSFNIRSPQFEFFSDIKNATIDSLKIHDYDKLVELECADFRLRFVFYGRKPNIILLDRNQHAIDFFKEKVDFKYDGQLGKLDFRSCRSEELMPAIQLSVGQTLFSFLSTQFYALNKILVREIIFRTGITGQKTVETLSAHELDKLVEAFQDFASEMELSKIYLIKNHVNSNYHLSIIPLQHLQASNSLDIEIFSDLNKAWWKFISVSRDQNKRDQLYKRLQTVLKNRLHFVQNGLNNLLQAQDVNKRKREAELKGNLLLTFKNQIKPGSNHVSLKNIFQVEQTLIAIKLNPAKSVVENANAYFKKYKDVAQKKELIQIKRDTLEAELIEVRKMDALLQSAKYPALLKLEQELMGRNLIQSDGPKTAEKMSHAYQFKPFVLDKKWKVYVGKNGLNNDQLTFKFAHKWDIWLHAQGVPGSHVIIHLPDKSTEVPAQIIEKAAQFAAAHSKARFAATVPVIYTEVRFVSRVHKAPPGTVNTRNEQVKFVVPIKLN